ncbi:MAG: TlpA family protein disulfide reductase [Gammaproteobacteria bacterium]|nr:TlpA family protein disulfide reductase [Gammaproteobacteria bacterium]
MLHKPVALAIMAGFITQVAVAAELSDLEIIPHLDSSGRAAYQEFLAAGKHRAFAIGPGGTWAWQSGYASADSVADDTLQSCEHHSGRRCTLYALNDRVVLNRAAWAGLLGPYLDDAAAERAPVGSRRGERFHDLAFKSPTGKPMKLSDLRGRVVVLHFWGSWCPPCRREIPELQQLHQALGTADDIHIVLLQVRENISRARAWAHQQQVTLPLYDSGANDEANEVLSLADGAAIPDRSIAKVFPTTYILDKNGVVVFSHTGPISRWPEYLPLLHDVAKHSP